jgi:hypothetical protein
MAQFREALREAAGMFGLTREGRERNAAVRASAPGLRWLPVLPAVLVLAYVSVRHGPAHWIALGAWVVVAVVSLVAWIRVDRRRSR